MAKEKFKGYLLGAGAAAIYAVRSPKTIRAALPFAAEQPLLKKDCGREID